jgi:hypothetical protein
MEAIKLLDIHDEKTGKKCGRRYNVEILNKSCIVQTANFPFLNKYINFF